MMLFPFSVSALSRVYRVGGVFLSSAVGGDGDHGLRCNSAQHIIVDTAARSCEVMLLVYSAPAALLVVRCETQN